MSLSNLQAIGRLQAQPPDPPAMAKLLQAARQNLADARVEQISASNRFDAAYKCILQCAMLGLWARGYRTPTSQPGHHQTTLQCLPLTMGLPGDVIIVLDALRKQRNQNDYEGDPVGTAVVTECLAQAHHLLAHTRQFLQTQFPALLKK